MGFRLGYRRSHGDFILSFTIMDFANFQFVAGLECFPFVFRRWRSCFRRMRMVVGRTEELLS